MKKWIALLGIVGIIILLIFVSRFSRRMGVCYSYPILTEETVSAYSHSCPDYPSCGYTIGCPSDYSPYPSSSGKFKGQTDFYCEDNSGNKAPEFTLSIWGIVCETLSILTPVLPTRGYFTTDEIVKIPVRVYGGYSGEVIYGEMNGYSEECINYAGQCELNFGQPKWGEYILEVWSADDKSNLNSIQLEIKPILKMELTATAYEQYNNAPVEVCAKVMDENLVPLAEQDIQSLVVEADIDDVVIGTDEPIYQGVPCTGIGNWKIATTTDKTGKLTFRITASKENYLPVEKEIYVNIKTPNMVSVFTSSAFGCLDEKYTAVLETKNPQGDYIGVEVDHLVVKDPDGRTIKDLTDEVRTVSTGKYEVDYVFESVEGHTFVAKVSKEGLGSDTADLTVGVSECGVETNWLLWIALIVIVVMIIFIVWRKWR